MPYYIYLSPQNEFGGELATLWDQLMRKVQRGDCIDLHSLQYPPHVTLSTSFEIDDDKLHELINAIKEEFSSPFHTSIQKQYPYRNKYFCSYNFKWNELSDRVARLKSKYPDIPWITEGYHITMLNGPTEITSLVRLLPRFPNLKNDFALTVWKTEEQYSFYSWGSKRWELLYTSGHFKTF